ncbi:hypothetical protein LTR53_018508, partial [Teratosphaeriaceae sp. CCFEE 6253]
MTKRKASSGAAESGTVTIVSPLHVPVLRPNIPTTKRRRLVLKATPKEDRKEVDVDDITAAAKTEARSESPRNAGKKPKAESRKGQATEKEPSPGNTTAETDASKHDSLEETTPPQTKKTKAATRKRKAN